MQAAKQPISIKFVAQVAPVKEVTLHGLADLAFWQEKLRGEDLQPLANNGQAQLFLSATAARFMGIQFRECIIGIHLEPRDAGQTAMYLLHAWNSLRAFAWIERNLFSTPYFPGDIGVEPQFPANFVLAAAKQPLVSATMGRQPREPNSVAEECWQGLIYLPRKTGGVQKLFVAKLEGKTEQFAFAPADDLFTLGRSESCPTTGWLIDSGFTPRTWSIRQAAAHAKSKTYRAEEFFGI